MGNRGSGVEFWVNGGSDDESVSVNEKGSLGFGFGLWANEGRIGESVNEKGWSSSSPSSWAATASFLTTVSVVL